MKIYIADIARIHGASVEVHFEESMPELDSLEEGYTFGQPVVFEGSLTNNSGILKLDGRFKVHYTTNCSRCLKPVDKDSVIDIQEDFVGGEKAGIEDAYTFQGNTLDISKALMDNLILNLPPKVICGAECKGICYKCGKNLNDGKCNCEEQKINPKMEVLKNFFNN